jgi:hypothetical protein
MGRKYWLPQHQIDSDCVGQVIDLNSNNFNERVSQQLNLKAGSYILHFNYYYPVQKSNLKQLRVSFNNVTLLDIKPQISASFLVYQFETSV